MIMVITSSGLLLLDFVATEFNNLILGEAEAIKVLNSPDTGDQAVSIYEG